MTRQIKESIQYGTATISLLSGIVLTFLSFFLNKYNISSGVLWYVSQTLIYAGSIFGVTTYINVKFGEIRNFLMSKENGFNNDTAVAKQP